MSSNAFETKQLRSVVVTGANKGIGLALVKKILNEQPDSFVFLGSRSLERGQAALQSIVGEGTRKRVSVLELDVTDESSVAKAVDIVKAKLGSAPLYGLVNNAGVAPVDYFACAPDVKTLDDTLKVNYYGLLDTTRAFLPLLDKRASYVVGHRSSVCLKVLGEDTEAAHQPESSLDDIEEFIGACKDILPGDAKKFQTAGLGTGSPYGISKACVNALMLLHARENPSLKINGTIPGYVATDLTRGLAEKKGKTLKDLGALTPEQGCYSAYEMLFRKSGVASGWLVGSDAVRSPLDRYRKPGTAAYNPTGML
eukprot:CAMPEP_0167802434 /NCGR_PEP_ID=MMETSP0111_2-20121227/19130_1 /TAXON_ID=91324 /ORGANISM="Lotharella globosa, Strain CCCM811" /LENGTH=310 /DNA_ID=CAMNT_0007698495 /DNA_START=21 /DNA_END=954 /DNA_ORIENTATION=-